MWIGFWSIPQAGRSCFKVAFAKKRNFKVVVHITLSLASNTSLFTLYLRVGLRSETPYSRRQPRNQPIVSEGSDTNWRLRLICLTNFSPNLFASRKARPEPFPALLT